MIQRRVKGLKIVVYSGQSEPLARVLRASLTHLHNRACPDEPHDPEQFDRMVDGSLAAGGRIWIARVEKTPVGYCLVAPLPGLPRIWEINGVVDPGRQRRDIGRAILAQIFSDLAAEPDLQITHAVDSLESWAAKFLMNQGFQVEHEEWTMILDNLAKIPPAEYPADCRMVTLPREVAIERFRWLYERCFSGLPWYQPYPRTEDVAAELADADDLVFLEYGGRAIGFLWLRWPEINLGEIEPLGVVPELRGRGMGRTLLLDGLARLAESGAGRVRLGVWRDNKPAVNLYRQLGFRPHTKLFYLSYQFR